MALWFQRLIVLNIFPIIGSYMQTLFCCSGHHGFLIHMNFVRDYLMLIHVTFGLNQIFLFSEQIYFSFSHMLKHFHVVVAILDF